MTDIAPPHDDPQLPTEAPRFGRLLTAAEFHRLADVPPEVEWFADLTNPNTRRAYENAVRDFVRFTGIARPEEFRTVTRAHVIAWRDELVGRGLGGSTIRHRLASLASLFQYLCGQNAVTHNPVKGVQRPTAETAEGKTPAIGDHQARQLLDAPIDDGIRGKRDRAILSTLLFHALRREELSKLKVKDFRHARKGVPHLKVAGKGGKTRWLPLHPGTSGLITDYLDAVGHGADDHGALFRPVRNNRTGDLAKAITPDGVYKMVRVYSAALGFEIGAHALRATAATNALDHQADIAKVRSGSGTPTSPPHGSTTIAARGRRTARPSRSHIEAVGRADFTSVSQPLIRDAGPPRQAADRHGGALVIEHRPWVGDRYAAEGIDGQRIAIMGFSPHTTQDYEGYTIECVTKVISGADRTMRFFNAIPDYFEMTPAHFYARVIFFEFVPCAMAPEHKFAAATLEEADAGRRRVLRIAQEHQVQKLLVFSAKAWSSMPPMVEAASGPLPSLPGTDFHMGIYALDGVRAIAVGIRHPQNALKAQMRAAVQAALSLPIYDERERTAYV